MQLPYKTSVFASSLVLRLLLDKLRKRIFHPSFLNFIEILCATYESCCWYFSRLSDVPFQRWLPSNVSTALWRSRTLSKAVWKTRLAILLGKITVLKTLVIPKLIHKASYLPIQLPENFVKQLNRVLFTFIWGSKWEKIGRSQLCCSIEEGGAKMIDVKQYLIALKFKWIFKIFNENFVADWKAIENICFKKNLLSCVLRSNCKFSSMMMNSLVFLRFSKSTLKTLKCILDISENIIPGTKFL